ncbi:MAG: hypothetical protein QM758_09525 [Armatimonas sp.]
MNRLHAFCHNELLIVIAISSLGAGLLIPPLLKHSSPQVVLVALGLMVALPLGALCIARWANRRKRYLLSEACSLIVCFTALPGIGGALGLLYLLSKAVGPLFW